MPAANAYFPLSVSVKSSPLKCLTALALRRFNILLNRLSLRVIGVPNDSPSLSGVSKLDGAGEGAGDNLLRALTLPTGCVS